MMWVCSVDYILLFILLWDSMVGRLLDVASVIMGGRARGIFVFCAWRSGSLLGAEVSTAQVSRNSYHGTTPR